MFSRRNIFLLFFSPWLLLSCSFGRSSLTRPNLLVPPPALKNCKAQSFIEHHLGENESIQDVAELYLGKREDWANIASCNPDLDPLIVASGTNIYVPINPTRVKPTATKSTKLKKTTEVAKKPEPAQEPILSTVPIRGEDSKPTGDIPKTRIETREERPPAVTVLETPPPDLAEEKYHVLPSVAVATEAPPPAPIVEPETRPSPLPNVEVTAEEEIDPLSTASQQTGSTLLLCNGKNCLPGGN